MNDEHDSLERSSGIPAHPERAALGVSIAPGALMGAAVGFFGGGGPIGALVGAAVGGAGGGGVAEYVRERGKRERSREDAR